MNSEKRAQTTASDPKSFEERMAMLSEKARVHISLIAYAMAADRAEQDTALPRTKFACQCCLDEMPDMTRWEAAAITSLAREKSKHVVKAIES